MEKRKKLKDLTIKDNFMFAAVMLQEAICRTFLEMTLGFPIERVEVSYEKSIVYHPEYKGIRLDVFAKDEKRTHYNVEMQVVSQRLEKRSRYYHSQMDMEMLLSGTAYEELPDAYVIFICDYDPFGKGKYRYTFEKVCREESTLILEDGSHSIFLSTAGRNEEEVPPELVRFLKFVKADLAESQGDFEDGFVAKLQESVRKIKANRAMEERYMIFEEMLRDEYSKGKEEGKLQGRTEGELLGKAEDILMLLEELGDTSEELREQILAEKDLKKLSEYLRLAARASSIEEFVKEVSEK